MQGQVGGWRGVSVLAVIMGLVGACDRPLVSLWRTAPAEPASVVFRFGVHSIEWH